MTRKTFIASVAALLAAPFALRSKKITIPKADVKWLNANPELLSNYERATWKVKGRDLYVILDKHEYHRVKID